MNTTHKIIYLSFLFCYALHQTTYGMMNNFDHKDKYITSNGLIAVASLNEIRVTGLQGPYKYGAFGTVGAYCNEVGIIKTSNTEQTVVAFEPTKLSFSQLIMTNPSTFLGRTHGGILFVMSGIDKGRIHFARLQ